MGSPRMTVEDYRGNYFCLPLATHRRSLEPGWESPTGFLDSAGPHKDTGSNSAIPAPLASRSPV